MSEREWRFCLADMIEFSEKVLSYSEGLTQSEFEKRGLNYDAIVRNLELIGESATHVPDDVRDRLLSVPWRQVIATRNRLIHAYLGIDDDTLWSIIRDDVPDLLSTLRAFSASE